MSGLLGRQFNPEGYPPLPKLRVWRVMRPAGLGDEIVECTAIRIDIEGTLVFSELVYQKNAQTDEWEILRFDRRGFRVWLDYEEIVGGVPMTSVVVN